MDEKTLQMQIRIDASAERVFNALTDAGALRTWLAQDADVNLASGRYRFWGRFTPHNPSPQSDHIGLLDCEWKRLLKFSWRLGRNPSTVSIMLREVVNHTVLTLIQRRGEQLQPDRFSLEDYWFVKLENLRRYIDGRSSEARIDFSVPHRGNIRHELESVAAPEQIYAVLTQPKGMEMWIASRAQVELRAGGKYDLGWGIDGIRVISFAENKRLTISWQEHNEEPTAATWRLVAGDGKTRIVFDHSGFDADFPNEGIWVGWLNYLNWIRSVAEYGSQWHPPAIALAGHPFANIYPKSMHDWQTNLLQSEFEIQ